MSDPLIEHPDRRFQIWAYTVGMSRLLLRSTKSATASTRIDVLFQNVKAIGLPTSFEGLVVRRADHSSAAGIAFEAGLRPYEDIEFFEVITSAGTGYVVAGVVVEDEDDGEYHEPSKYWPKPDGGPR